MRVLRAKDFLEWANAVNPEHSVTVTIRGDGTVRISALARCCRKRAILEVSKMAVIRNTQE